MNDVAGVLFVTDQRESDCERPALMTLDERPEGRFIAVLCAPYELKVYLRFPFTRGFEGTRPRCGTYVRLRGDRRRGRPRGDGRRIRRRKHLLRPSIRRRVLPC